MAGETEDFRYSSEPEPHKERTRAILRDHPEVRGLIGRNPWSFALILGIVALQMTLAWALRDAPWWLILATAWLVGAFANHALYVLIHEAAISFRGYHLKHHSFQGVYELDPDVPSRWEARLIGSGFPGKAFWLLFFPIFQTTRPPRLEELRFFDRWVFLNWVTVVVVDAAILLVWGPGALGYLLASLFFSVGLHPLGARWIQEHYLTDDPQETYSYYGVGNIVALNVGYHNEHHDFPSVPWNRLPKLRAAAPEYYDHLAYHGSWTGLLLHFLFDRELTLCSRMIRTDRGGRNVQA